ncbi:hypothetical protein [Occallatibacter savannae]|uniref:hypothetical protein n=1 Tax=Occallatibacter savannae TaxID=1002691 RepID=UPI0013A53E9B|nr:hypothetical protein [Occallatibacter savannae]
MNREYIPTVGEEVLLVNHLGTFMVEEVDCERKTASVRVRRSGLLMEGVEWRTIWPLDAKTRAALADISRSEEFQKFLSKHIGSSNDEGDRQLGP